MKKLLSVLLVFAIVLSFTACGGNGAKDALNKGLTAFKNFDRDGIEKYFVGGEMDEDELAAFGEDTAKAMFGSYSWKIKSCEEDGDEATAEVEITCLSLAKIMSQITSDMMTDMLAGTVTEDNYEEYLANRMKELIKSSKSEKVTETITITLEKIDDQWMITNVEDIANVMLVGMEGILGSEF